MQTVSITWRSRCNVGCMFLSICPGLRRSFQFHIIIQRRVSTSHNPQVGGPLLVACPLLLIRNIRSCPPYVSNQRVRLVVLTGTNVSWKDNIRMNLQEYYGVGEWTGLAHVRDKLRTVVNTVLDFRFP